MSDEVGKSQGFINEYAMTLHNVTAQLQGMFVTMEDGVATGLTPLGETIKDTVIFAMEEFGRLLSDLVQMAKDMTDEGRDFTGMITLMTMPLRLAVKLMGELGPNVLEALLLFKMVNGVLPITNGILALNTMFLDKKIAKQIVEIATTKGAIKANLSLSKAYRTLALSQAGVAVVMMAMIMAVRTFAKDSPVAAAAIGALAGAILGVALAMQVLNAASKSSPLLFVGIVAASMLAMAGVAVAMQQIMKPPKVDYGAVPTFGEEESEVKMPTYDMGGMVMYDTGGPRGGGLGTRHKPVLVEPGEKIIPKTQTMLGAGGITLNMGDVMVQDGEDFAERVAAALPEALRKQNDIGGI
tara:strand:+ start:29 stop:1090 length:1062 start_codon:yes stop_codon:yes gene_type:complete